MSTPPRARRLVVAAISRQVAAMLATLVTIPIIGHHLGADALGAWALAISGGMLVTLADLGLSTAVRRAVVNGDDAHAQRSLRRALVTAFALGGLAVPLARVLIGDIGDVAGGVAAAWLLPLAAWLMALTLPLHSFVLSYGGVVGLAGVRAGASVLQIAATIGLLPYADGLVAPALGVVAGSALELLGVAWLASRLRHVRTDAARTIAPTGERWADLRDGSAALVINAAVYTTARIDCIVLARVAPLAAVASYGVAARIVDQSYLLAKQVSTGMLPMFRDTAQRRRALELGSLVLAGLVGPGMIALAILGGPLLELWAGAAGATFIARASIALLGAAAIVTSFGEIPCSVLTHTQRSAWSGAMPVTAGAIANAAITLGLTPSWGFWGAALGTLCGATLTTAWVWQRVIATGLADGALLGRVLGRIAGGAAIAALIALALRPLPSTPAWALVGAACATGAGFLVTALALRHGRLARAVQRAPLRAPRCPAASPVVPN